MWGTSYIQLIQRQFIDVYYFPENPDLPGLPMGHIPDGDYPMTIDGRLDHVKIINGMISCGNFDDETK